MDLPLTTCSSHKMDPTGGQIPVHAIKLASGPRPKANVGAKGCFESYLARQNKLSLITPRDVSGALAIIHNSRSACLNSDLEVKQA